MSVKNFNFSGRVHLGLAPSDIATAALLVIRANTNAECEFHQEQYTGDASAPTHDFRKARGTYAAPADAQINDRVIDIRALPRSTTFQFGGAVRSYVDGPALVAGQNPPSRVVISTNLLNVGATEQQAVFSNGVTAVGTALIALGIAGVTVAAQLGLLQLEASARSGIFLGNTANGAANVLDWYEEGTWTPSILVNASAVGITYTTQTGRYTRVGNRIYAKFSMVLSNKGASVGTVDVLAPFNIANALQEGGYFTQITNAALLVASVVMKSQGTNVMRCVTWGAAGTVNFTDVNLTNTTRLEGTLVYEV